MRRRLIGEIFPVKEVSRESSREKSLRHGHISTLHVWWARRPLAASRASLYASLVDPPKTIPEWSTKNSLVAELSRWESVRNTRLIRKIRDEILSTNGGKPPKVLDPFGGGGVDSPRGVATWLRCIFRGFKSRCSFDSKMHTGISP